MIKMDISIALFLYLFSTVIIMFVLWMWLDRRPTFNIFEKGEDNIRQCAVCNFVYMDIKNENFSRCPRCKSMNKKSKILQEV